MSFNFTAYDIQNMKNEILEAGYIGPFYDWPHVVYLFNVWIVKPLGTYPGGKTK